MNQSKLFRKKTKKQPTAEEALRALASKPPAEAKPDVPVVPKVPVTRSKRRQSTNTTRPSSSLQSQRSSGSLRLFLTSPAASTSSVSTHVAGASSDTLHPAPAPNTSPSRTVRSRTSSHAGSARAPWRTMSVAARPAPSVAVSTATSIFSTEAEISKGEGAHAFLQQSLAVDSAARAQDPVVETLQRPGSVEEDKLPTPAPPEVMSTLAFSTEEAGPPPPVAVLDIPFPSTPFEANAPSVDAVIAPNALPEPLPSAPSVPEQSVSWFGSLSRAAGRRQTEAMVERQNQTIASQTKDVVAPVLADEVVSSNPTSEIEGLPTPPAVGLAQLLEDHPSMVVVQPPTPKLESSSPASASVAIPNKSSTRRGWFSTSPRVVSPLASPSPTSPLDGSRTVSDIPDSTDTLAARTRYPHATGSGSVNASTTSIPSSIDEDVPPPISFPMDAQSIGSTSSDSTINFPSLDSTITASSSASGLLSPTSPGTRARLSSITSPSPPPSTFSTSALNPSTSRFTLSIPLLGRAKIPLERAVAQANVRGSLRASASTISSILTTPILAPPPTSGPTPFVVQAAAYSTSTPPSREESVRSETRHDAETPPIPAEIMRASNVPADKIPDEDAESAAPVTEDIPAAPIALDTSQHGASASESNATWWGYVGWGGNAAETNAKESAKEPLSESTITTQQTTQTEVSQSSPSSPPPTDTTTSAPFKPSPYSPLAAKAMSIRSTVTQSSSWYSPWAWYPPATAPTAPVETPEPKDGLTEAQAVKEEALAREEPALELRAEPETAIPIAQTANPLIQSVAANTSGWTSFFAAKSAAKTISGKPHGAGDGMEVMDVPDDEPPPESASFDSAAPGGSGGDGKSGKKPAAKTPTNLKKKADSEPAGDKRTAPPLTNSESVKAENEKANTQREGKKTAAASKKPAPPALNLDEKDTVVATGKKSADSDKKSGASTPTSSAKPPPPPNLVLPTWGDTFHSAPRSLVPLHASHTSSSKFSKTIRFVSKVLLEGGNDDIGFSSKGKERETEWERRHRERLEEEYMHYGQELPRAWDVVSASKRAAASEKAAATSTWEGWGGRTSTKGTGRAKDAVAGQIEDALKGAQKVVILGIHGWFPGNLISRVVGEPTGTSTKFVSMMTQALEEFQDKHGVKLTKITGIPLEGEGTIDRRVDKLYKALTSNKEWMDDLHNADVVFVATHSQGSIVSTHLLDRLIRDKHVRTKTNVAPDPGASVGGAVSAVRPLQRICCLALCGIHLGPLRYLANNSVVQPYLQYFESAAALELFEFQNTESAVSQMYVTALKNVVDSGTKMVYVASLNDQVVPIYSGVFASSSHPLILRALYIDGDAYHSSDFLSNLIVLLIRIRNAGLSDSGLLTHLSEATAGSLNGVGHSTAYEDVASYSLAVNYLFLTNDGTEAHPELYVEPFNASTEQNDYEIPWSLRDVIADESVQYFFSKEIAELREGFQAWHPKTTILRDLKRKLQPIQKLPSRRVGGRLASSNSKL